MSIQFKTGMRVYIQNTSSYKRTLRLAESSAEVNKAYTIAYIDRDYVRLEGANWTPCSVLTLLPSVPLLVINLPFKGY